MFIFVWEIWVWRARPRRPPHRWPFDSEHYNFTPITFLAPSFWKTVVCGVCTRGWGHGVLGWATGGSESPRPERRVLDVCWDFDRESTRVLIHGVDRRRFPLSCTRRSAWSSKLLKVGNAPILPLLFPINRYSESVARVPNVAHSKAFQQPPLKKHFEIWRRISFIH